MDTKIIEEQLKICDKYSVKFTPTDMGLLIGISDNTDGKNVPINGLRHPAEGGSTGWYIWSGEGNFPQNKDFFKPMHVSHLVERCPQVLKFLGLPVGYRFLIDNEGYMDVWYDEKLLNLDI